MELTTYIVERTYEQEVVNTARQGEECGIWQVFQASGALNRIIKLLYPEGVEEILQKDFTRYVYPRIPFTGYIPSIHVLWCYCNRKAGIPNHFVAVLGQCGRYVILLKAYVYFY